MKYFPLFFDLRDRNCLVVGGGRVAERKVRSLRRAGAAVTVVSPRLTAGLERLSREKRIDHRPRPYRRGDLKKACLAVAATDDPAANEKVFREASALRIPVNTVDDPARCTFIVPSVVCRGDLLIAISTGGRSPALAKALRRRLEEEIGPEYPELLRLIGTVRRKMIALGRGPGNSRAVYRRLLQKDVARMVRRKDRAAIGRLLQKIAGPDFPVDEMGLKK